MHHRKASNVLLIIAVSTRALAVQTAEVCLEGDRLHINRYVEFSLTSRRTLDIDKLEAEEFVWQISKNNSKSSDKFKFAVVYCHNRTGYCL